MLKLITKMRNFVWDKIVKWLTRERPSHPTPLSDFERLRYELRPGDVILVEGRSKVSDIIKMMHAAVLPRSVCKATRSMISPACTMIWPRKA